MRSRRSSPLRYILYTHDIRNVRYIRYIHHGASHLSVTSVTSVTSVITVTSVTSATALLTSRAAPLQDLRSPLHNALFCNWFNEYVRFGERDQIAMSYVLHRMGLTAGGTNASAAVRFIERDMHYLTKPTARKLTIVKKVGHRKGSRKIRA